jgi:hypothetical protein
MIERDLAFQVTESDVSYEHREAKQLESQSSPPGPQDRAA